MGVVIVGGGQAGGRAALALRAAGYDGPVTLLGEEEDYPYERPPLSKAVLTGARSVADGYLAPCERYGESGIDLRRGVGVTGLDLSRKAVALADGSALPYEHLILATGAVARRLPIPGADLPGAHLLRTGSDALALRATLGEGKRLVVIGGGFIGLEVAASARSNGCQVTVLEAAERLLTRSLPEQAATVVAKLHAERGVEIETGVQVTGIEGKERATGVRLGDGRSVPADAVLLCIGIVPETMLAAASGLEVEDGIVTDSFCRTEDPNVFAVGDCARAFLPRYGRTVRLESYQNANLQAETAAAAICGEPRPYDPVPWLWSDHYDWVLQTAGLVAEAEEIVTRGRAEDGKVLFFGLQAGRLASITGLGRGTSAAKDVRAAQMMIEQGVSPDPDRLAEESLPLKRLLKGR